jgi:RNA polymerase sigma-70 factor, ECF subfamily
MIGPSFEAVLAAAAGGDELAFGILWRDLQPGLLRYLNALAPGAGEDLASETWLRVVGRLDRFAGDERAFRAWVFTVARHRAVDRWRRSTRRSDAQGQAPKGEQGQAGQDQAAQGPEGQAAEDRGGRPNQGSAGTLSSGRK